MTLTPWVQDPGAAAPDSPEALFASILAANQWQADRRGEVHITCPNCGKDPKSHQVHFSFGVRGGKCFVCGWHATLMHLGYVLADIEYRGKARDPQAMPFRQSQQPSAWRRNPEPLIETYRRSPDRIDRWRHYKPMLMLESIQRWELGVGVLPSSRCQHRRLIVPARSNGDVVAVRGRLLKEGGCDCANRQARGLKPLCYEGCNCPKWLTAGGSETVLYNADSVVPGKTRIVLICENMIDVILAMQLTLGGAYERQPWFHQDNWYAPLTLLGRGATIVPVCSTGGAASWRDEWTEWLTSLRLDAVIVWYDNDYPGGLPNRQLRAKMLAAWRNKNPKATAAPLANGERLIERLSRAHLPVSGYEWPATAAPHMDLGELLYQWHVVEQLEATARSRATSWKV